MTNFLFNPKYEKSLNQKFREKRFLFFRNLVDGIQTGQKIRILDIGGTEVYWERMKFPREQDNVEIILCNLFEREVKNKAVFTSMVGDATDLSQFKDNEFDIIYSNSVIEHLFTLENQMKMANEIKRVGKNYFVQTPNYYFPLEPHWLFPFFQFFPFKLKVFLTRNFRLGHIGRIREKEEAIKRVREVNLLTERGMKRLFPESKIYRERAFGLKKSFSAYRF